MTLADTGPMVALIDTDYQHHIICETALEAALVTFPLLTTWPCLDEAMHLLWRGGGYRYQATLWSMYLRGEVVLHQHTDAEIVRMAELMEQYQDTSMDLADASLVATAESPALRRVFTVDRQFYVYRTRDGSALEAMPWGIAASDGHSVRNRYANRQPGGYYRSRRSDSGVRGAGGR